MPALLAGRPQIGRLRVSTARRDSLQATQRAGALLDRLDLSPPGLPPSSILLVRSLRDPLPGRVSLDGFDAAPAQWREAVAAAMARMAREAVRPALAPASSRAGAVLFADEAEMIACLVRDWLAGRVADRWWWESVLGSLNPRQWLRTHVLMRGELLVPVVTHLAATRHAVEWLARLEEGETAAAIAAIERSHSVSVHVADDRPTSAVESEPLGVKPHSRAAVRAAELRRLIEVVPEVRVATLGPAQRRLTAVALAIARVPSWARSAQLAFALRDLEQIEFVGAASPALPALAMSRPEAAKPPEEGVAAVAASASPVVNLPEHVVKSEDGMQQFDAPARHSPSPVRVAGQAVLPMPSVVEDRAVAQGHARSVNVAAAAPPQESDPQPASLAAAAARVRTEFGGIFYLLNAALALKLYADFATPRGANLRVSPWDWLALVGRAWFGRAFVRDPLWKLLSGLAGRGGRRLRRPRWLAAQLEQLLARIELALGEKPAAGIPAYVCRHAAEVAVTASRVDVHLVLVHLPLALRIAGLDRDPGWIPAAGRTIGFHFE